VILSEKHYLTRYWLALCTPMMTRILHLSHTDIRTDARILKEMNALDAMALGVRCIAIGVARDDPLEPAGHGKQANIRSLRLLARHFKVAGKAVRRLTCLVEMNLRMWILGLVHRPKIVHCHDAIVLPAGWCISRTLGSSLVYDAHELESHCNPDMPSVERLALWLERWSWSRVSLLVSVSPSIINWYQFNLGPKQSVLVMNAPVVKKLESVQERSSAERTKRYRNGYLHDRFGVPPDVPVFVNVGFSAWGRGVHTILEVFSRPIIKSHVVFLGSGDVASVMASASGCTKVHFHPAVPHDEVVQVVRSAQYGFCIAEDICLNARFSLPNRLFEYAAAGVPVLASRLPEIARVVEKYGLGICCANDADSIEAAVRKIEQEGIEAPRSDLTDLSWETQSKQLQQAYLSLLSGRGLSPAGKTGRC